jgi:hypothetical protein
MIIKPVPKRHNRKIDALIEKKIFVTEQGKQCVFILSVYEDYANLFNADFFEAEYCWILTFLDAHCQRIMPNHDCWLLNTKILQLLQNLTNDMPFLHSIIEDNPDGIEISDLEKLISIRNKLL